MVAERLIYVLVCPFTSKPHYVGKTTTGMTRPLQHSKKSHSDKVVEWVDSLKELGHKPEVKIVEYVPLEVDIDARELYWIQHYISHGQLLFNKQSVTPMVIRNDLDVIFNNKDISIKRIACFIKARRKIVGLTQEEFAEKAGVGLRFLRKLEQGNENVMLDKVLTVLRVFGSTLDVIKIPKD